MCIVWCGAALQDTCALCVSKWEVPLSQGGWLMWSHRANCRTGGTPSVTPCLPRPPNAGPSYGSLGPGTHMLLLLGAWSLRVPAKGWSTYVSILSSMLSLSHVFSIFYLLSGVFYLRSSIPFIIFYFLSSIFYPLSSLSSIFYLLSDIFSILSSIFYLLPFSLSWSINHWNRVM